MYHLNILIDICWNFSDLLQGTRTMHPIVSWTIGSQSSQTVMPVKMDMSKYCLQCHKCVYLGKQREKWPTWCQAWPFYGKPQQPPCAQPLYFRFSYVFTLWMRSSLTSVSSLFTRSRFSVVFIAFLWWALCLFRARLSKATTLPYCSAFVAVERKGRGTAGRVGSNKVCVVLSLVASPLVLQLLMVNCACVWASARGELSNSEGCVSSSLSLWILSAVNMAQLRFWGR